MGAAADQSSIAILVVAGGRGSRAGDGAPKQYRAIAGKTLLARTLHGLHVAAPQAAIKVVIHRDDFDHYAASAAELSPSDRARLLPPAFGGATRQDSVRNGLEALATEGPPDIVLIHD
ncbi:MAG: 2-C-methyl-D-erythritol 4-phosphate cytidylyltransferase, partial [Methylocystis sp.]